MDFFGKFIDITMNTSVAIVSPLREGDIDVLISKKYIM